MDIESQVKKLIVDRLDLTGQVFSMDDRFSDLGVDSLDAVELIMAIEDEFEIVITDEESQSCTTTNAVIALVRSKLDQSA
jgi:acyl carrier protein